jgi:hypothetical protein
MARRFRPQSARHGRDGARNDARDDARDDALSRQLDQLHRSLATALSRNGRFEQMLDRRLASFERQLESHLERLLLDLLTSSLTSMLGGQNAATGPLNAMTNGVAGQLADALLPKFAAGGIVDGARILALGGEAGPEAVVPLTRGPDGRLGIAITPQPAPHYVASPDVAPVVTPPPSPLSSSPLSSSPLSSSPASSSPIQPLPPLSGNDDDPTGQAALATVLAGAVGEALDQAITHQLQDQLREGGLLSGESRFAGGFGRRFG